MDKPKGGEMMLKSRYKGYCLISSSSTLSRLFHYWQIACRDFEVIFMRFKVIMFFIDGYYFQALIAPTVILDM